MSKTKKELSPEEKKRRERESLIETIESIIVAFILAFVFRAFVIEAFVIPTGSMAPELNGRHAEATCPDCGYEFALGINQSRRGFPRRIFCPNCLREIAQEEVRSLAYSGDRILVLKFIYNFWEPERWDVIVFKNPNKPRLNENYIKRLVGLPGDRLSIHRGDLYVNNEIARKPDKVQDKLWTVVHDTLYKPTRAFWEERWQDNGGWKKLETGFATPAAPAKMAFLTYRHRNRMGFIDNINDFAAYAGRNANVPVTDLSLKAWVKLDGPASRLRIVMTAYKDTFEFDLAGPEAGGKTRISFNGTTLAETDAVRLPLGEEFEIQAANVDHKLVLRLNGRRVFDLDNNGAANENDDPAYEPTSLEPEERVDFLPPDKLVSIVRLGVAGGRAQVRRLIIKKDVYYTDVEFRSPDCDFEGRPGYKQAGDPGWATRGNPVELKEDEFFVLGDNSAHSLDSRLWWNRGPRSFAVPRKNLVGKAFFVYWPAAGKRFGVPFMPDITAWRMVH